MEYNYSMTGSSVSPTSPNFARTSQPIPSQQLIADNKRRKEGMTNGREGSGAVGASGPRPLGMRGTVPVSQKSFYAKPAGGSGASAGNSAMPSSNLVRDNTSSQSRYTPSFTSTAPTQSSSITKNAKASSSRVPASTAQPVLRRPTTPPKRRCVDPEIVDLTRSMERCGSNSKDRSGLLNVEEEPSSPTPSHPKSTPIAQKVKKRLSGGYESMEGDGGTRKSKKDDQKNSKGKQEESGKGKSETGVGKAVVRKEKGGRQRVMSADHDAPDSPDQLDLIGQNTPRKGKSKTALKKAKINPVKFHAKSAIVISDDEGALPDSSLVPTLVDSPKSRAKIKEEKARDRAGDKFFGRLAAEKDAEEAEETEEVICEGVEEDVMMIDELGDNFFASVAEDKEKEANFADAKKLLSQRIDTPPLEAPRIAAASPRTASQIARHDTVNCPFCPGKLPESDPGPEFWALRDRLYAKGKNPSYGSQGLARRIITSNDRFDFCLWHDALNTSIPLGELAGYPIDIDFMDIPYRLEKEHIREPLEKLAKFTLRSEKFIKYVEMIGRHGEDWWQKAQAKDMAILSTKHVGYYGDIGRMVISEHFRNIISWGRLPSLTKTSKHVTPLSSHEYIEHNMIPEASILLIQDDLAAKRDLTTTKERASVRKEAEQIWKASAEYGKWKFRESSERCGQLMDDLLSNKPKMQRRFSKAWIEADKVEKARKEVSEPEKRRKKREAEVQEGRAGEGSGSNITKTARTSKTIIVSSPDSSSSSRSTTSSTSQLDFEVTGGRTSSKTRRSPSKHSSPTSSPSKTGSSGSSPTSHSSIRTTQASSAVNNRMDHMVIDHTSPPAAPLRVSPPNIPLASNKFPGSAKRKSDKIERFNSANNYGMPVLTAEDIARYGL